MKRVRVAAAVVLMGAAVAPTFADELMGVRALGSSLNDWVFTPLPACRILDTRPGSGIQGAGTGPYAPGSVHAIDARTVCGIPPAAKAAVLNFVAVAASGNGNLRAWPWDASGPPAPGTAVLNFTAGFNTSNGIVQPICNTATATAGNCTSDLFVQPFLGSTHVAIDTLGYFSAPRTSGFVLAAAQINGTLVTPTVSRSFNSLAATAVTVLRVGTGLYEVGFGADVSARFYVATLGPATAVGAPAGSIGVAPRNGNVNAVFVQTYDQGSASADLDFYITVY